jgi:L-lactate dehydrogenase complex protein LldG
MNSRDSILGRIRAARAGATASRESSYAAIPREYRQTPSLTPAERLALFEERLRDYGVHTTRSADDAISAAIARILQERQTDGLLIPPGFPAAWLPAGFHFTEAANLSYHEIDAAPGVITQCAAAIALTGTIILRDLAPGQGARALSLIPDYHLCIVSVEQLFETVPEAIRAIDGQQVRTLTTISGPSATSDIEMTRVRGVHGPRTLEVIISGCL